MNRKSCGDTIDECLNCKREMCWEDMWEELKNESRENRVFFGTAECISPIIEGLIEARHNKGWTQRELATACGMGVSAIKRMERFVTMPKLDDVIRIAQELGMKIVLVQEANNGLLE